MLHLFFTITFIAEIIVGCWIVSKLRKLDEAVLEKNKQVLEFQPKLKELLASSKININKATKALNSIVCFIGATKCECKKIFSKNLLSAIGCMILKIPFKKILAAVDVILTMKKLLKV